MSKKAATAFKKAGPMIIPDPATGAPAFAVLPYGDYERLLDEAELREDIETLRRVKRDGLGELIPHDVMKRLLVGDAPLRVWREYRGLSQGALAKRAHVSQPTISQIESGDIVVGNAATIRRLAQVLEVEMYDLLPDEK